ncbi:curli assembly protein CsgF [Litorimonas sp. RW-G-Af-16]|uniref:curli assembly protein CsgF n=1 Tax=Litorimonas sp. RW-G-Af-16 TaxID=3241168 RepID=UPI003AAAD808
MILTRVIIATSFLMLSSAAYAQDIVFEPINPSFGGNSFNSAHLLAIANAQNDYERPQEEATSQDDLDRFIRSLQSRLLSSLSTQVSNAIFGEDAQDSGIIIFGDQTIEFVRGLDGVQLTITEADGSQTIITVPTLITDTSTDDTSGSQKAVNTSTVENTLTTSDPIVTKNDVLANQTTMSSQLTDTGTLGASQQPIH